MRMGMKIMNTYFRKRRIKKWTWVSEVNREGALLDYICVGKDRSDRVLDVTVRRGAGGGLLDHFLVVGKLKVKRGWKRGLIRNGTDRRIRIWKLEDEENKRRFRERLGVNWERTRGERVGEIEDEWRRFKEAVLQGASDVCGFKVSRKGKRNKRSEWWSDEIGDLVRKKKEAFVKYLGNKSVINWEVYKDRCREVKRGVKEGKRRAIENWSRRVEKFGKHNNKKFWREVNRVRLREDKGSWGVRNGEGVIVKGREEVVEVWGKYFEKLVNERKGGSVQLEGDGDRGLRRVREADLRMGEITREEIIRAVKSLKNGKAAGGDGILSEMLKAGLEIVYKWLGKLFNGCWVKREVPQDWQEARISPIYKGKGEKTVCGNYRGISMMSVVGKVYGRIIIDRMKEITGDLIGDEQGGFRKGRGCIDQVFILRKLCEKYREKGREVYVGFMDLEKAYDKVEREALWIIMGKYGIG